MMDATDAWAAVRAARTWVCDTVRVGPGHLVVDLGSGPGTFGALAAARGAATVDVDRSRTMLGAARRRGRPPGVCADIAALPLRAASVTLARMERVLQWSADPDRALVEVARLVAPRGTLAVTDTDWSTLRIDHDDPGHAARWTAAAQGWVPHAGLAASLPERLGRLVAPGGDVALRRDTIRITAWDPDDGNHADGPPGLPLASIAAGAPTDADRAALADDVATLAARARTGHFRTTLDLVTVCARLAAAPDPD